MKLPRALVARLRPGRYRIEVTARAAGGPPARAFVPFAVVRHRR